jgi:hypothetical protein
MAITRALRDFTDERSNRADPDDDADDPPRRRRKVRMSALRHPVLMPTGFFLLTLMMLALHLGKVVEAFFPLGAFAIACLLYRRSPPHFMGFVCWLFFLAPLVRRVADFGNGFFNDKSMIMMAPVLAVALCGLPLITDANTLGQRRNAPLVMIVVGLTYGFFVGALQAGFAPALYTLINWVFPPLVAFYLNVTWQHYPAYQRVLLRTGLYGGLLMGVYGIIQYIFVPPWDLFWFLQIKATAFGNPVPFGLRVWSTMNSPGTFAVTIMYLIQMSLASSERIRIPMALASIPALLFTSVRTCWAGLVIGLIYPIAMLDGRSRRRLLGAIVGAAVLCAPVMMFDQVSGSILKRVNSVDNLSEDNSFQSRAVFYQYFLTTALTDVSGEGLGATGLGAKLSSDATKAAQAGGFDSGVMEVPFVLGWPGTLLYVGGIFMLMWRAFLSSRLRPRDRFAICGVGVALAIFSMMIMTNTLISVTGMFYFIGVTMPVMGLRYARHAAHASKKAAAAAAKAAPPEVPAVPPSRTPRARASREFPRGGVTSLYRVRL